MARPILGRVLRSSFPQFAGLGVPSRREASYSDSSAITPSHTRPRWASNASRAIASSFSSPCQSERYAGFSAGSHTQARSQSRMPSSTQPEASP